ncbi:hypothetical protein BgiBS90_024163 [Biomphalaria glabrata]|nr:hypothetical protein BgiBS90_024163 [Biomphalaria glabrata]
MPECRRDQTKLVVFLVVMVVIETAVIFSVMHMEHKKAENAANKKRAERQLELLKCPGNRTKCRVRTKRIISQSGTVYINN